MVSSVADQKGTLIKVRSNFFRKIITDIVLLLISSLLFSLSFPSFLSKWGFFPLAFISIAPVFIVIHRNGWLANAILGLFYGYTTYAVFNFWLVNFHPLAYIIVPVIYAGYFFFVFLALKAANKLFPKYGYLVQIAIWMSFEFVRTLGFLGYGYGIIGYSQYLFLPLARSAAIAGVWGVSLIVIFPSAFLGNALRDIGKNADSIPLHRRMLRAIAIYSKSHRIVLIIYAIIVIAALIYGFSLNTDFSDQVQWKVATIQQNTDPWKGGIIAYQRSFDIHTKLSVQAEEESPDIIVWSETAFVPGIDWHMRYRTNKDSYRLVKELTEYLSNRDIPYLIGNDDRQLAVPGKSPVKPDGTLNSVDYNAAILYYKGEIVDTYRKVHLVPFTESFPFKESLPGIYNWLKAADTHFWEKGTDFSVFEANGVRFSTPICYEDTFGYISREFIRNGAQVIVNLTNDSWSKSVAAEMQHMAMSVFRALENRRTMVRSSNGGITCTIEPDGEITKILEPFTEAYLVNSVPVYDETGTLYTRFGDWLGIVLSVLAAVFVLAGAVVSFWKRSRKSARK
jgi:apolipoprotein N-acyltransferase